MYKYKLDAMSIAYVTNYTCKSYVVYWLKLYLLASAYLSLRFIWIIFHMYNACIILCINDLQKDEVISM